MRKFFRKLILSESDPSQLKRQRSQQELISEIDHNNTSQEEIPFYNLAQVSKNLKSHKVTKLAESTESPINKPEEGKDKNKDKKPSLVPQSLIFASATEELTHNNGSKRYQIYEPIGEGGTAIVYRAVDLVMNRDIAFKSFCKIADGDEQFDFLKEIETISKITHPNVVVTHDAGKDEKGPFIVMSLIKGMDLQEFLKTESFDLQRFKRLAYQTLDGLFAVHTSNILHLDIKPSNIMVSNYGGGRMHVQLIDFGSSRVADENGQAIAIKGEKLQGSIFSMSPEQFKKEPLDVRSDIYSLGCVFYEVLTGKTPFQGDSPIMVMASHLQNRYTPLLEALPTLPQKLAALVTKMISSNPKDRQSNVAEILTELSQIS